MPKEYKVNGFTFTMPDEDEGAFCGDFFDFYTNYWRVNGKRPQARDSDRTFMNDYFKSAQQEQYDNFGSFQADENEGAYCGDFTKYWQQASAPQEPQLDKTEIEGYTFVAGYRVIEDPTLAQPFDVTGIQTKDGPPKYAVSTFMMKLAQQHPESFAAAMNNLDTFLVLYRQKQYKKIFNFLAIYARRQR